MPGDLKELAPLLARIDPVLLRAFRAIRLLGSATPTNSAAERERLVAGFRAGGAPRPAWTYERRDTTDIRAGVAAVVKALELEPSSPLRDAYLERGHELLLEAELAADVGTHAFAKNAAARFPFPTDDEAMARATAWIAEPRPRASLETILSDSNDPRSLLSQMRKAVGTRRLPFRVMAHASLAALAATGEETIVIARGRELTAAETVRTVVHEIHGHAEPRTRARGASLALFTIGTARGVDEQEGLALVFEERAGLVDTTRRRQLAARHLSAGWMASGAAFEDVVLRLTRDFDFEPHIAVPLAERAFRGSDGRFRGLGRDVVYLDSLRKVERAIERGELSVLASGQIATAWAGRLAPYAPPVPAGGDHGGGP